jgi:hydroxymethylpyrimidine pyrophosphatase-like HAD family hydrolase
VSAATLRAADALKARGVPLLAATARAPLGMGSLHDLVPFLRFAVCCSGAAGFVPATRTLSQPGPRFVEVTAAAVTKASGVVRALQIVEVPPERAVAFGDMPIDAGMFSVVGHSVAMAGAPADVLAAATARTASVDDDGFARMLNRLGVVTGDP